MRAICLVMFAGAALGQQSPPGDVFMSGAQSPVQAFFKLRAVAEEVVSAPGADYQAGQQPDFPKPTAIQAQWFQAMAFASGPTWRAANGNSLTAAQRQQIVECAPHLNNAIGDMERGYRISINQPTNAAAQKTAQKLYAIAKNQMTLCANASANQQSTQQQPAPGFYPGGNPQGQPITGGTSTNVPGPSSGGGQPGPNRNPGQNQNPNQNQNQNQGQNQKPNPLTDTLNYGRGLADGIGGCVKGFADLLAGADSFLNRDFVNAAKLWGLSPGQSMTLKMIFQEAQTQVIGKGVSAYEAGNIAGRRLCAYGIVPGLTKAAHVSFGPVGKSPLRAINGSVALDTAASDSAPSLANNWVQTAKGPVKLGGFIGKGEFGAVFEDENPNRVAKISNSNSDSAASFPRQQQGANRLTAAGIQTPKVYEMTPATPGKPAVMIMDNAMKKWPGATTVPDGAYKGLPQQLKVDMQIALEDLGNQMGAKGLVWADGHVGNAAFLPKAGGGLMAIPIDADMIYTPHEMPGVLNSEAGGGLVNLLMKNGFADMVKGQMYGTDPLLSASTWMHDLFRARFGGITLEPGSGGTVPRGGGMRELVYDFIR